MILGVSGTRYSERVSQRQIYRFREILAKKGVVEVHHGDCTGWDEVCFNEAAAMGIKTVCHPPDDSQFRAFTASTEMMSEKPYLVRNRAIVDCVSFMVCAPDGPERMRSGTWSTIRYAKRRGVRGLILPF